MVLEEDLFAVVKDLLEINAVEVAVVEGEDAQQVGPRESFEVLDGEHVHHLSLDGLAAVQIVLHHLGEAKRLLEFCREFGVELHLFAFFDELEGETAKPKVFFDHVQLLKAVVVG